MKIIMSHNDSGEELADVFDGISTIDVILNKMNQLEVCKMANVCAQPINQNITDDNSISNQCKPSPSVDELASANNELQRLQIMRHQKEEMLSQRYALLTEMLRKLQKQCERFSYDDDDDVDKVAPVISNINCMRRVLFVLGSEHVPKTMAGALEHLELLEKLSEKRRPDFYNFVPKLSK